MQRNATLLLLCLGQLGLPELQVDLVWLRV
jgi:hypothetical protein